MEASTATRPDPASSPTAPRATRPRRSLGRYGLLADPARAAGLLRRSRTSPGDGNLSRLANNLFAGLSNGTIIALIAIGYTLVYGIIELINFAHGDVFMIGSFTASQFWAACSASALATQHRSGIVGGILLSLVVAMLVCGGSTS